MHPPLKEFITSITFHIFGIHERSYTFLGLVITILAIISIYSIGKQHGGLRPARISAIALAGDPLFVSVGFFGLTDFVVAALGLAIFACYSHGKIALWGLLLAIIVLTKETAALLPVAFIAQWLLRLPLALAHKQTIRPLELVLPVGALGVFFGWLKLCRAMGGREWGDWIFATTSDRGSLYTIFNNVKTGDLLNQYAVENYQHLLLMNFGWLLSTICLYYSITIFMKLVDTPDRRLAIDIGIFDTPYPAMVLYAIAYTLLVLSFQTYTIPRYVLPVYILMLLPASYFVTRLSNRVGILRYYLYFGALAIMCIRFVSSSDPVSVRLWGTSDVLGQRLYALHQNTSGNDGMTYNGQFLQIIDKRTALIRHAQERKSAVTATDCHWIFPDRNNDYKVLPALGFTAIPGPNICVEGSP